MLVVDDDRDGAEGIADILDAKGFAVTLAHEAAEALTKVDSCTAQVALVDLRLGRDSGLDLIISLKAKRPELICLVVTANTDKDSAVGALRRGAYDYLTKPVDPQDLLRALQRAFDLVRLAEEKRRMIDELQLAKERAEALALVDALTGLANRHAFQSQLNDAINQARRLGSLSAILILDLDGFKEVNDTYGHLMGDELLKRIARRLEGCARVTDTIARLGGDEFALVLVNLARPEDVMRPAELVLQCVREPITIGSVTLEIGASIGVSLCPIDGEEAGELIRRADVALYEAKAAGRGVVRWYDAEMDARARAQRQLEADLRRAFINNEFEPYYQPQVALPSRKVVGVEALLRWRHPRRGVLPPAEFISATESCGLIVELGQWMIWTACRQAQDWANRGLPAIRMAVNISLRQLHGDTLVDTVEDALAGTGLVASRLELELTESMVMGGEEEVTVKLQRLRALGVQLAIDDFGTGYSSLSRLKEYPVDRLKIDRCFVRNLIVDPGDQAICSAAVQLAASLGLGSVAEGVETKEQLEHLLVIGCDEAQGYYFSEPLPASDFERWFRSWSANLSGQPAARVDAGVLAESHAAPCEHTDQHQPADCRSAWKMTP